MLDPFAHPALSVSRLSKPALLTAVVLHLGLLWVALNSAPMVRSAEQVVYQWVAPITPQRDVSVPITLPTPVTTKTIAPPVAKPIPTPRAAIAERAETPPPEPKPEIKPVPVPVVHPPLAEAASVAEPAKPLPEPSRVRREPVPLPLPAPVLDPKMDVVTPSVNVQVQAPPPVAPQAPVPLPEVVAAPAPVPKAAPPPAVLPVAVAPPVALPPRSAAITATEKPVGSGGPNDAPAAAAAAVTPASVTAPSAPATDGARGLNLNYPTSMLRNPPRQRSAAELANEQLNGTGSRNRLGETIDAATRPDCFGKEAGAAYGILAPIVGVVQAVRDKCK